MLAPCGLSLPNQPLPMQIQLAIFIYLYINYKKIPDCILIIYELSNFKYVLGVMSQTRVTDGNRTHDSLANGVAHYPLDYQGTHNRQ